MRIFGARPLFRHTWDGRLLTDFVLLIRPRIGNLDILAEFSSPELRGRGLIFLEYFWAVGTIFVNGVAWACLDSLGWRWMVGLTAIPVVLALPFFRLLPESPHWLLSQGRSAEALQVNAF